MPALMPFVDPATSGPAERRFLLVLSVLTALVLVVGVGGFGLDFSAGKYMVNDAALGEPAPGVLAVYPFNDFSGLAHTVPGNAHVAERIAHGELPLWDRMQAGGWSPVVAVGAGAFHPLRWSMAWLPPHLATSGLIVVSTALALAGFVLLARALGAGLAGAGAVGIAWLLLPHSLVYAQMDATLVHAFAPWILLAALRSRRAFDGAFVLQVLGLALLALSGHPLLIVISGIGMALFLGLLSLQVRDPGLLLRYALASVFGAALAAVALVPFAIGLATEWNYKTETPFGRQFQWADWEGWVALWSGLFRLDPGPVNHDDMPALLRIPLVLAMLFAAALVKGHREPVVRAGALVVLAGLLLAVPGPWGAWLAQLPVLGTIKTNYLLALPLFYLALLAALALRLPAGATRGQHAAVLAASVALLASSVLMLPRHPYWQPRPVAAPALPPVLASDPQAPFRLVGGLGQVLLPNLAALGGYEDIRLVSPLQHRRFYLYVAIANSLQPRLFPVLSYPSELDSPLLPIFNVRYAVGTASPHLVYYSLLDPEREYRSFQPNSDIATQAPADARLVSGNNGLSIVEYANPRPRAYFASEPVFSRDLNESAQALLQIQQRQRPASQTVIEADPQGFSAVSFAPAAATETIHVSYPGHRSVSLDVVAAAPRLLVLNDTYAAGWRATVDGTPVPIVPVNLIARGVVVPAGEHSVEMHYTPPGLLVGALIGVLALLGLYVGHQRRGRSMPVAV